MTHRQYRPSSGDANGGCMGGMGHAVLGLHLLSEQNRQCKRTVSKSNQTLFRNNNKNTCTLAIKTKKCCYLVVTWHIMCPLPVTPKHKLIKYRYIYTYARRITKSLFSIKKIDNIIYFDNGLDNGLGEC